MAVTIINYTGDGTTNQYAITFTYLNQNDVAVTVNEVAAPFTFVNSSTVQITTTPSSGDRIVVKRNTSVGALVDFTDGSTLYEADLDLAIQQARFLGEEARDRGDSSLTTVNNNLDDVLAVAAISSDVTTVSGISGNVTTVAGNTSNINTVAGNNANVSTVAGISSDVSTVSSMQSNVASVVSNQTNINAVAGDASNISTVAGISSDISTVSGMQSDISSVIANQTNINAVASDATNISTVAGISSDISAVSGNNADVSTVAGQINNNNLQTIASDIASVITTANDLNETTSEIETVANAITNVDTVGAAITNVNQVATDSADINTLAGISADIQALADIEDGTTATNTMQTVATNITDVNTFATRYRIGATNPTTDNDEGDLFFNTATNQMLVYNSGVWTEVGSNVPATITIFEFTATAGQTVFTGNDSNGVSLDYNITSSFVALNGVIIPPEDYTTTSATTLTLDTGANLNDTITIYSFSAFTITQPFLEEANGDSSIGWNSANSDALEITRSDDAATAGPIINLKRNSASPVDDDLIGEIQFTGKNDAAEDVTYGKITVETKDVSDSGEDGKVRITPTINGSTSHSDYYEFDNEFRLNHGQTIRTMNIGGNAQRSGQLLWETGGTQTGQVKLPLANGTISHLAWDHLDYSSTNTDNIQFAGISGLPDDVFHVYEVYFSCQPQTADSLVMTFQGETGGEINSAGSYSYFRDSSGSTSSSSSSSSSMQISGPNVGTLSYRGVHGKLTIGGFDHDGSNFEMPPNIFGQYVMFNNNGSLLTGYFGGALNTYADVKGFNFKWNSGNNFRRADFRVYGIRNER